MTQPPAQPTPSAAIKSTLSANSIATTVPVAPKVPINSATPRLAPLANAGATAAQVTQPLNCTLAPSAWPQITSVVAAVVIGIAASTIAFRNWQTAAQKLKLDFYKPRFDIYSATSDYLNFLISSAPSDTSTKFNKFLDQTRPAAWLFNNDAELLKMLQTIKEKAIEQALTHTSLRKKTESTIEYDSTLAILGEIAVSLQELRDKELAQRFGKYLSLTNYSWLDSLLVRMRRRK